MTAEKRLTLADTSRIPGRSGAAGSPADCADARAHVWEYLDEEVSPLWARRIRVHLTECPSCRGLYAFERGFLRSVRAALRAETPGEGLQDRVLGALEQAGCRPERDECDSIAPRCRRINSNGD